MLHFFRTTPCMSQYFEVKMVEKKIFVLYCQSITLPDIIDKQKYNMMNLESNYNFVCVDKNISQLYLSKHY